MRWFGVGRSRYGVLLLALAATPLSCSGSSSSGGSGGNGGSGGGVHQPDPQPTPVGTSTGAAETTNVGTDGGTLLSSDGRFEVTLPAGALAAPTDLTLEPLENQALGGVGAAYRIGPEGVQLLKPVDITFHYDDQDLAGTTPTLFSIAYQDAEGRWHRMTSSTLDESAGTITVSSPHFSDWSLVPGLQIRPPSATVQVNGSVELEIQNCVDANPNSDLSDILYDCDTGLAPLMAAFPTWSATAGSVSGKGLAVSYKAPAQVPSQNPVAVSATLDYGKQTEILVSNITVKDQAPGYTFTVHHSSTTSQVFDATVTGTLDFESQDAGGKYYTLAGTLTFQTEIVMGTMYCTPTIASSSVSSNGASVLHVSPDGSYTFDYILAYDGPASCVDKSTDPPTVINIDQFQAGLTFYPGCNPTSPGMPTTFQTSDPTHIQGSGQDGCVGATSNWDIKQQ